MRTARGFVGFIHGSCPTQRRADSDPDIPDARQIGRKNTQPRFGFNGLNAGPGHRVIGFGHIGVFGTDIQQQRQLGRNGAGERIPERLGFGRRQGVHGLGMTFGLLPGAVDCLGHGPRS